MQMNSFVLLIVLAVTPFCTALGSCSDKTLFSSGHKLSDITTDKTLAYNHAASCATLKPDSTTIGMSCCYIKVKFKNAQLDEKFTQKGCIEMDIADAMINDDFDGYKDAVEDYINKQNPNVEVKSLSIDCNSKFLHLAGIALIFFLL